MELALHDEDTELLAQIGEGIGLQRILGGDDARLVVRLSIGIDIAEVTTQIVIELGRQILLLHQIVLETEQRLLGFVAVGRIGIVVKECLIGIDGSNRRALVETGLRSTLIERTADEIASLLGKGALGISAIIFTECSAGRIVVAVAILRHTEKVETLLSIGATFLHGNQVLQQSGSLLKLAHSEALLSVFIFICVVRRLVDAVKLRSTTRKQSRQA